jgi:glycyl-tRNA synthetase beta chain
MADANINNFISGDFLFELGAEELPSGQIKNIADYFSSKLKESLDEAQIIFATTVVYYTPRRITILIRDINLEVQDKEVEIKGPPEKITRAPDGKFTPAALGFLKKNNGEEKDAFFKDNYLFIKQSIKGQNAQAVLEKSLPEILKNTPGVRFMRWANSEAKFARPPQWMCAILADKVLDFELENLRSSNKSYGHRFLGPEEFTVKDFDQYVKQLEKQGVTLDQGLRKEKIVREANALAKSIGAETIYDDALLDEISLITENPSPVLCDFDSRFLQIPECVLTTVMIQHQRYIPLKRDGKLIEQFITISNNPLEKARHNIKVGNEKVIVPRFKDAEFFVHEDNKISLDERFVKLDRLNFLKGSMQQKAKRLEKISEYIASELEKTLSGNPMIESKLELDDIKRAALLAKADLSTNLVFEFTELQGEIGGIYAAKQGFNKNIQESISEHYLPRFAGDKHPQNIGGKIIAIADKVDNIVCSFALGKIPSGSADPFALRRQANGLLEIIIESRLIMDIEKLIKFTCELQEKDFGNGDSITKIKGRGEDRQEVQVSELTWQGTDKAVIDFIESRLEFVFEQRHKNKDINKSVLSKGSALKELNKRHMTIHFLASISAQAQFEKLVEGVNRLINICKGKEISQEIKPELFETDYEKEFYEVSKKLNSCKDQNLNYDTVYNPELLFSAADAISKFFDNVLVNSEEEKIRLNRQALVAYANNTFKDLADFSLIK